jgi:hypothetical protein
MSYMSDTQNVHDLAVMSMSQSIAVLFPKRAYPPFGSSGLWRNSCYQTIKPSEFKSIAMQMIRISYNYLPALLPVVKIKYFAAAEMLSCEVSFNAIVLSLCKGSELDGSAMICKACLWR